MGGGVALFLLHVPVDRGDVVAGEHAGEAVTRPLPPVGVGVVQNLDEISTPEAQLAILLGVEVKQRLHIRRILQGEEMLRSRSGTPRASIC